MCNKFKSVQHFAVASAKRVSILQASLKLVKEPNSLSEIIGIQHLMDQNIYI